MKKKVLFSKEQIQSRVSAMAEEIDSLYAGEELTTIDLAASEDIHRSWPATAWYYLKKAFSHWPVRIGALVLLLALIALLIWLRLRKKQQKDSNLNMIRIRHDIDGGSPLRGVSTEQIRGKKSSLQRKRESRRRHRSRNDWRTKR